MVELVEEAPRLQAALQVGARELRRPAVDLEVMRRFLHDDEDVLRGNAERGARRIEAIEKVRGGEMEALAQDHGELLAVGDERPAERFELALDVDDRFGG